MVHVQGRMVLKYCKKIISAQKNFFLVRKCFFTKSPAIPRKIERTLENQGLFFCERQIKNIWTTLTEEFEASCIPQKVGGAAEASCPRLQGHSRSRRGFLRRGGMTARYEKSPAIRPGILKGASSIPTWWEDAKTWLDILTR